MTFAEFKDFYLDHTQRTQQQRRRVVTARLESTPRGRAAKKKWQAKVHTLNAVRMLGRSSAVSASDGTVGNSAGENQQQGTKDEPGEAEEDRRTSVKLTGTQVRTETDGKEYTVYMTEASMGLWSKLIRTSMS